MQNHGDWNFLLKEFHEESIEDDLDYIKFIHDENKTLQRIREKYSDNWKIVEACREILFENRKKISLLTEEIQNERIKIKELGRILRRGSGDLSSGDDSEAEGTT